MAEEGGVGSMILVVDLDGTLVHTDLLHESFWSAFAGKWMTPLLSLRALAGGRARLKQYLAEASNVDVALLPYNEVVLDYVRQWQAQGGRSALVTASDQIFATKIAAHLDLFDHVHGSDGSTNLKGKSKAELLNREFSETGFAYMGDAPADLPVWECAQKAITVNASPALKGRLSKVNPGVEHLETPAGSPGDYFKALRVHQWLKNLLVFIPMLAAHQFTNTTLMQSILAFVAFNLIASSVYLVNDLLDLGSDRTHPQKRFRSLAAGKVPIGHAVGLAAVLLLAGLTVAAFLGVTFLFVMAGYYACTTTYSLYLKRHLIVDIVALAALYTTRIIAGAVATDIILSVWLLAFSMFFFFSLAAIKRQAELVAGVASGNMSANGRGYRADDLPIVATMAIASGYVSVLVMVLFVSSSDVTRLYSQPTALWGICLVLLFWISRMVMLTHRGHMHDDPIVFAIKDRASLACAVVIAICAILGTVL